MVKNLPAMQETWVWSLGWEDLLEKGMTTHFSTLAGRIPLTERSKGVWDGRAFSKELEGQIGLGLGPGFSQGRRWAEGRWRRHCWESPWGRTEDALARWRQQRWGPYPGEYRLPGSTGSCLGATEIKWRTGASDSDYLCVNQAVPTEELTLVH